MKKVLIVGGTSSLSLKVCSLLENNGYQIDVMTYRNNNKINNYYKWIYLNLEDISSIDNLLNLIPKNYYSKIIIFSGNAFIENNKENLFNMLKKYYESYLFNYIYMTYNFLENINESGQIISISSLAANKPVTDMHYSAVKGGVQSFLRSLSLKAKPEQALFSISPATITEDIRDQIAQIILKADSSFNGKIIEIGY